MLSLTNRGLEAEGRWTLSTEQLTAELTPRNPGLEAIVLKEQQVPNTVKARGA
jgi:hypothetical protein